MINNKREQKNNLKDWTLNPKKKISNKREQKILLKIGL